ncbi:MAG TPA: hypothetical protein VLM38_01355 [Blastocatellia bacterium]|nr:hypothetical protein [Blastocatellia bacterium]
MRVTIILETGAFLHDVEEGKPFIRVGYFETPFASDIEVHDENGQKVQPPPDEKLGKGNKTIEVEHVQADGTVKKGLDRSPSFQRHLLLKEGDLYAKGQVPDFIETAYDCIFHFHSGKFESAKVKERRFTKHRVTDDGDEQDDKHTRPIANEILVHYNLRDGEILRLRRANGTIVWSSESVDSRNKSVEVRLKTDDSLKPSYHKKALKHVGPHYYLPNSDPPPMDSSRGG